MEETQDKPETMELGGNIELSGFSDLDGANLVVVKKMIGNYAKKLSSMVTNFEKLSLHLKEVHKKEGSGKFELHAKVLFDGKIVTSEMTDRNLYFAIDKSMKKLESELEK